MENELTPNHELEQAVTASDAERVAALLTQHPDLRLTLDKPLPNASFGENALYAAVQRSDRKTIEILLGAGAHIEARTDWWAGSFGVLDECHADLAPFLLEKGAVLDAHSAARLGLLEPLREMVSADPAIVHARSGDGQTPLHFASTIPIAEFLLAHGADVNALDIDHESTPAQYMLRVMHARHYLQDRQPIARYLLAHGAQSDLLMAAALGDEDLVKHHLQRDPNCILMDVSERWFPRHDPRAGGTIYIWTLGKNHTAPMVARDFGHESVYRLLLQHTPSELKLALACELGDEESFHELLRQQPDLTKSLSPQDQQKLPNAAQSNNTEAVRLMLEAGWPVDVPGEMGATALHWAGYNGNVAMAREILRFHPTLTLKSRDYESTALQWALFASNNNVPREGADFAATVQALQDAQEATFQ